MREEYLDIMCRALPIMPGLLGVNIAMLATLGLLWIILDPTSESFFVANIGLVFTTLTTGVLAWHLVRCRSRLDRRS